jgi:hypothetical protein
MEECQSTRELTAELELFMHDKELHRTLPVDLKVKNTKYDDPLWIVSMIGQLVRTESFYQMLCRFLEKTGYTDIDFYTDSTIGAATFSNMRDPGYRPSKDTVFKCLLTLRSDYANAVLMLEKSGYTFVWTEPKDLVIIYCVMNGIYCKDLIDELLYSQRLRTLFSLR